MTQANTTQPVVAPVTTPVPPTIVVISEGDLITKLLALKGATFVTFTAVTDADTCLGVKKGLPANIYHKDCFKTATVNGIVNFHYDAGVIRRLLKENNTPAPDGASPDKLRELADAAGVLSKFKEGTSWHQPIVRADGTLTPLCQHKKNAQSLYLRFQYRESVGTPTYATHDGKVIDPNYIKPYLPAASTYENQGLVGEVLRFLVYAVRGITRITMMGTTYSIAR
jgi:hypothetical protein